MRAHMVVPIAEGDQVAVELFYTRDDPLVEFVFQRAEEALNPAVLPGASGVD